MYVVEYEKMASTAYVGLDPKHLKDSADTVSSFPLRRIGFIILALVVVNWKENFPRESEEIIPITVFFIKFDRKPYTPHIFFLYVYQ